MMINLENMERFPKFVDSPALNWYGHLVPKDGVIDAADAKINWNYGSSNIDANQGVRDVAVLYYPKRLITDPDHPLYLITEIIDDKFICTHGNIFHAWMTNCPAHGWLHPDVVWRDLSDINFYSLEEAESARLEFARIRECRWARESSFRILDEWIEKPNKNPQVQAPISSGRTKPFPGPNWVTDIDPPSIPLRDTQNKGE